MRRDERGVWKDKVIICKDWREHERRKREERREMGGKEGIEKSKKRKKVREERKRKGRGGGELKENASWSLARL